MSMTGYGRSVISVEDTRITVEVKTVNHRFLDLSVKMPRSLLFLEDKMKKQAQEKFKRGRVDIFVTIEGEGLGDRKLQVDWDLMDQFVQSLKQAKDRFELKGDITIDMVTQLNDLFTVQEQEGEQDKIQKAILSAQTDALDRVGTMRLEEGTALKKDLVMRTETIRQTLVELESRREIVIEQYRDRIKQRIEEYVNDEFKNEDSRILQEVALLAEKGDISEELTRLSSHIEQLLNTLVRQDSIGRKLDFIVQEMHRETNTIGSKSNDVKISEWVVHLKSEIEKIKEQVQNVE